MSGDRISKNVLTGVCRRLQREAEETFYDLPNNTFMYSAAGKFPCNSLHFKAQTKECCYAANDPKVMGKMGAINLSFTMSDSNSHLFSELHESSQAWRESKDTSLATEFEKLRTRDKREMIHDLARRKLMQAWTENSVEPLVRYRKLRSLEIDLTDCYCPTGCC